jgi:protein phosphatase
MTSQTRTAPIDRREMTGPFDIVGDVHGCTDELLDLMTRLGYGVRFDDPGDGRRAIVRNPAGRRLVFVGDLVDRGPRSPDALRIAMAMVESGQALCVPGNHDAKFLRWLQGRNVKPTHGLDATIAQMSTETASFHDRVRRFIEGLPLHVWLDQGGLVVAHAGIREEMIGSTAGHVRHFCLYGDTDGTDEHGLPIRYHWAAVYSGATSVVYGHTPLAETGWVNNTLCIDTGCCFGGALTALRWPEREIVSVPAREAYAERRRPPGHPPLRPAT